MGAKREDFARMASEIEINRLGAPIGKQDQYAAAYGGLRRYAFNPDGSVKISTYKCTQAVQSAMMLFRTDLPRASDESIFSSMDTAKLLKMKTLIPEFIQALSYSDLNTIGKCLHRNWVLKRSLNEFISNDALNAIYTSAIEAGALGGKLLGAGGGGYFLFCVEENDQAEVIEALDGRAEHIPFKFESKGTHIIE